MLKKVVLLVSVVPIVIMFASLVVFSGCKDQNQSMDAEGPIEVIDAEGNGIILERPAEKVIVLAPSVLEITDGLGALDKVVEIDSFTVMMEEVLAEGFEGVGDYQSLNVERIAELDPDIVITIVGGPEDDYNKVKELGIPVYRSVDVRGMDGVYEEISNISKLLGFTEKGTAMVEDLKSQVEEISSKVEGLAEKDKPKVFYEVWNEPLMSAGVDTFINSLIDIAGGVNILSEDQLTGWVEYSVETLIEKNPDIIIAPVSLAAESSVILEDQRFASIKAVINEKVYIIPDNSISRPNQNIIKGLQMLAKAIHPEIFGEFEIVE